MKSFKQYLLENPDQEAIFTSGDHVWAIDPDKKDELLIRKGISHKEAFPHLFDREGEPMGGVRVHGRIGWNKRGQGIISIVTGGGRRFTPSKNRRANENDIYERIGALDLIQAQFPDQTLLIHHAEGVMHTPREHKKHLMGFLAEGTILRRSFKQYLIENLSSSESLTVPQGVLIHGDRIIVGVRHGEDLKIRNKELLRLIQSHGQKHGYYFEGTGGPSDIKIPVLGLNSKEDYRGGWDEDRLNKMKKEGIQPHHLSALFANVDANWKHGISDIADDKSSIFDGIHRWANSKVSPFSGIEINENHITSLLKAMSPGTDRDWLRDAQETRASPDAVKKFLKDAEKIAWPAEWSTKKRSTGPERLADKESKERNSHIIDNMPRGVFIAGAGHLLQIRDMLKDRGLREGEREGEFQFHGGEDIEP